VPYQKNNFNGSLLEKQRTLFIETKAKMKGSFKPASYKLLSCLDLFFLHENIPQKEKKNNKAH